MITTSTANASTPELGNQEARCFPRIAAFDLISPACVFAAVARGASVTTGRSIDAAAPGLTAPMMPHHRVLRAFAGIAHQIGGNRHLWKQPGNTGSPPSPTTLPANGSPRLYAHGWF
jgi:hypothetical protein